ncbi:MmpS family transport accessory protein [Catenuloplanes atrovinosus]|uniref:MmpS family membrane protein n=1 Tax=Catenuloplanes atrovinosus TaxID=137266 RepID=A0AAE3YUG8_9ACTN|nr:MmpS family transport accessory protein [Catenuloplanes atrovinosus]MDR7279412.1 hypothetical protein [Catenuloplanes atrovinosus]
MTEPNPPSHPPEQPNPWARPPEGATEQPMSYGPPPGPQYGPPQPTAAWAYDPNQPPVAPPRQRSLTPIIAVIVAAVVLLCAGTVVAGVLVFNQARDAAENILPTSSPPTLPTRPTAGPEPTRPAPTGTDDPFQIPGLPDLDDLIPTGTAVTAGPDAKVVYEVTGSGSAAVTYTEAGTTPKSERDVNLPWRKEFTLGTETPLLSVTGIHFGTDDAELTCRITLDGKEVVTRTASGNATTASCMQFVVVS